MVPDMHTPPAAYVHLARAVKEAVPGLPVVAVDHAVPTRAVGERTVHEHDRGRAIGLCCTSDMRGPLDQRSDLNAARTSLVKSSGSCQAAKWFPSSSSLKYTSFGYACSVQLAAPGTTRAGRH